MTRSDDALLLEAAYHWRTISEETLRSELRECQAKAKALEEQNKRLIDGYREAIDDIEDWAAYAGDYFQEKHDLDGCIAAHKELLIMLGPLLSGGGE